MKIIVAALVLSVFALLAGSCKTQYFKDGRTCFFVPPPPVIG